MASRPPEKSLTTSSSDDDSFAPHYAHPEKHEHHGQLHELPQSIIASEVVPGSGAVPEAESYSSDSDPEVAISHHSSHRGGDDDIPDGGFDAWFQLFASWVLLVDTWGVINCYGVYQTFYERGTLFERSASELAWVGSLQSALLLIIGSVVGPLYDAGNFRYMMWAGVFSIVFGMFMVSLCHTYWQVMLAQGLCIGLGCGLTFLPSTAILSQYFKKRLGLAIGISATGSPIAGIIFPIMFGHLEPKIGFAWATRAIAFILLALSIIPVIFMRTRVKPVKRRRDWALIMDILKDGSFMLATVGLALTFMTMYIPYFYVQAYAIDQGITTKDFSPYLITIVSAGSIPGRVIPNHIGDKIGSLNVLIFMSLLCVILTFAWISIHSLPGMILFCIFYGTASGGIVSGAASTVVSLSPEMSVVGTRMGFLYTLAGFFTLIGPPVAGVLIGTSDTKHWTEGISWAGAGLSAGCLLLSTSRMLHFRLYGRAKL